MHYIRFLKTPKVHVDRGKVELKAVVVVTTDLGETSYPEDVDLVATLRAVDEDGEIFIRRKIQWTAGSRSNNISFDLSRQDIEWPACLHVAVTSSHAKIKNPGFLPSIVDVWSDVLNPVKGRMNSGHRVERRFRSITERGVSLLEDAGDSIARHLWDGSQVLAQYFDQTIALQNPSSLPLLENVLVSATYHKINALELGCGCGTVGISLAQTVPDCHVLLTDLEEVQELVQANIERMKPAMSSEAEFEALDWEQPLPEKIQKRVNDLIIVSECTYNTDTLQPLVKTLLALTIRSPKAVIIVSTKTRHDSEAAFFDMMKNAGLVQNGTVRVALPGIPGTGYADGATDVGLHVFQGPDHRSELAAIDGRSARPGSRRASPGRQRPHSGAGENGSH